MPVSERREFLKYLSVAGAGTLAGCISPDSSESGGGGDRNGSQQDGGKQKSGGTGASISPAQGVWRVVRGTSGNLGYSSDTGPRGEVSEEWVMTPESVGTVGDIGPVVDEDAVYSPFRYQNFDPNPSAKFLVRSFSRQDGSERWSVTLGEQETEGAKTDIAVQHSAALGREGIYVWRIDGGNFRNTLYRLSRDDGNVEWKKDIGKGNSKTRQLQVHDAKVYLAGMSRVRAFSTQDGSQVWESDEYVLNGAAPAASGDSVVVEAFIEGEGDVVVGLSPEDGTELWRTKKNAHASFPVVAGDTVYTTDGGFAGATSRNESKRYIYALDVENGEERWSFTYDNRNTEGELGGAGTVAATRDRIYFGLGFVGSGSDRSEDDQYTGPNVFALSSKDGSIDWKNQVGEHARIFAPPVVGDGAVYVNHSGDGKYYSLDSENGEILGSFGDDGMERSFAVAGGTLFEHTRNGIRAFR